MLRCVACLIPAAIAVCLSAPHPGAAQDVASPGAVLAPFTDGQVVAVVRLNPARIEPQQIQQRLSQLLGSVPAAADWVQEFNAAVAHVEKMRQAFLRAGGREVYLVVSLADLPGPGPFAVLTIAPDADRAKLAELVGSLVPSETRPAKDGRSLVVGQRLTLERLEALTSQPRPELVAALSAEPDAAVQVVVALGDAQRRVVREMMPRIPTEYGTVSVETLSQIRWISLAASSTPRLSARLSIETETPAAAQSVAQMLVMCLQSAVRLPEVRQTVPTAEQLALAVQPRIEGNRVVVALDEPQDPGQKEIVVRGILPSILQAREAARRSQCANRLKQIGVAMHNYYDMHKQFPAADSRDAQGKPLLSWRVALLPFLDQQQLYQQFKLNEPWDSENNRKLVDRMPPMYACPSAGRLKPGTTTYVVPRGAGTVFGSDPPLTLRQIRDGTSNTMMVIEIPADQAVIWTKPDDAEVSAENALAALGQHHRGGFQVLFCDGSVRFLENPTAKTVWAWMTADGGEVIADR